MSKSFNELLSNEKFQAVVKVVFILAACFSVLAIILISAFLFFNGISPIKEIGLFNFLFKSNWHPTNNPPSFGILSMIVGSMYVSFYSILFAAPIGVLSAVYLVFDCSNKLKEKILLLVNLMAAIPSVIYGFFGMIVIVPFIRNISGDGNSILSASILLAIMILPTIISISYNALNSVPFVLYENAIALGSTHEYAIYKVMLKSAKSGIMSSLVLAISRAIGETMAVIMVIGNQAVLRMPFDIFKGVRTLTGNIVIEMGYAAGLHRQSLIASGLVLFILILSINSIFTFLKGKNYDWYFI